MVVWFLLLDAVLLALCEDRCEEVLPELVRLHEEDGTSAVERRGRELGLEVQDDRGGGATIVLTEDGKPFATISTISSNAFCNH